MNLDLDLDHLVIAVYEEYLADNYVYAMSTAINYQTVPDGDCQRRNCNNPHECQLEVKISPVNPFGYAILFHGDFPTATAKLCRECYKNIKDKRYILDITVQSDSIKRCTMMNVKIDQGDSEWYMYRTKRKTD